MQLSIPSECFGLLLKSYSVRLNEHSAVKRGDPPELGMLRNMPTLILIRTYHKSAYNPRYKIIDRNNYG